MRKIEVDGERWKWSVTKVPPWSEYTPAVENVQVELQGPDGYRRTFAGSDVTDEATVTPGAVAAFIRSIRASWPCESKKSW